ncbi:MAG TPA: hypothetical protein VFG20_05155 [Planctomycetaceae bacterium]|jgi:hypothetical protein|nr:hypothetical protein [Planctomycetaceae bacterium]
MWQLWRPFVGIHRWYFSRGCPPPLRELNGYTRCVHAGVLCAAMGLVTSAVGFSIEYSEERFLNRNSVTGQGIAGLLFGLLVLLPISRWLGRPWWLVGLSVLTVTTAYSLQDWSFEGFRFLFGETMWLFTGMWLTVALVASLPMMGCNLSSLLVPCVACTGAYLAGAVHWMVMIYFAGDDDLPWLISAPVYYLPDVTLFVVIAIAVGLRLWPVCHPVAENS